MQILKFDCDGVSMNKKILGIRIGTILSVILSLITAVVFWLFVKYSESGAENASVAFSSFFRGFIW